MLKNLKAEMARCRIKETEMAEVLGISRKALNNMIMERTEFRRPLISKVQQVFFPNCTIEYLFTSGKLEDAAGQAGVPDGMTGKNFMDYHRRGMV